MNTRPVTLLLMITLIAPSLFIMHGSSGSDTNYPPAPDEGPVRSLSSNVTGGLYGGLITYEDVALIVNDNSETSKDIGTYFAMRRGIPEINIINISVPEKEIITESEYDELARQVKENLSDRGLTDSINYFVTTKGVPLKVTSGQYNMNYQEYYESASVDSELMLLDSSLEYRVHGLWPEENPYAGAGAPFSREEYGIRLVTRLTGYTKEEAKSLVDRAESSFNVRGRALLDMDPSKNGSGGYRQGNQWMEDAHAWLITNNHTSYLEATRDFYSEWTDTMAYYSWGSNDGDWSEGQMTNGGFEYGTGTSANGWTYEEVGGIASRTTERDHSGDWSLKLERNGSGVLRAYQDINVRYPDHRFILDGRMSISDVTSPGSRILLEGYDRSMNIVWTHTLANRTGSRGFDAYQDPIENHTDVTTLRLILELLGEGAAYFDNLNLRVVRPHNQWLNGSIAETIVSTGGRSMTYGTWYGQSLVADIIRDGVTGIKGYTWEPFISAVSRAHILIPAYYIGYSLAESFWMGSPFVSWMGTVIGDPKCTPFINERADMGPALDEDPIRTWVDEDGTPGITVVLHNKGNRSVEQGTVVFYMEGDARFHQELVDLPVGGKVEINLSSRDHPIIGRHTFTVVLDPEDEVWEYDEKNNEIEAELEVNHVPVLEVSLPETTVIRTEPLKIMITIEDLDGDVSLDLLGFELIGPYGREYTPVLNWSSDNTTSMEAEYHFVPPWDAALGFYSLEAYYKDPRGSFSKEDLGPSVRVKNADPVVWGNLTIDQMDRGGSLYVNISWFDADTPDGSLEIEIFSEIPSGGKMMPAGIIATSNWSSTVRFDIPADESSGTWTFTARVMDRNGGGSEWSGYLRSVNRPPILEVVNGTGSRVTRLNSARFVLVYSDPEGQASGSILAKVYGPQGAASAGVVFSEEFDLPSDDAFELLVPTGSLPLGNYTLMFEYEDDEGEGGELTIPSAFTVYNIKPAVESLYITYPHGEGIYGETFLRSRSVTLTMSVMDLDSAGRGLTVTGRVLSADGSVDEEVFFDLRGEDTFISKLTTASSWPLGGYGIEITVRDPDGELVVHEVDLLFVLDAEAPFLQTGELFYDLNSNATVEVTFGTGPGATHPRTLEVHLYSTEGELLAWAGLVDAGGSGLWKASVPMSEAPEIGNLRMVDDEGRTMWFNDSLSIEIEKEPEAPIDPAGGEDDNSLMLLLMILAIVLVLAVLAIISALVLRSRSDKRMMSAPPHMMGLEPQHVSTLGPVVREALPPTSSEEDGGGRVPPPAPPLPPGAILDEGASYHKPDQTGAISENNRESVRTSMEIHGPAEVEGGPQPPDAADGQAVPDPSEPYNTPSDVAPPEQNVRYTDDNDVRGDNGQGEPKSPEGPGGGP
ncbi:MAG: TIGR03790 family protein [Thermoplasmatota archaeon]